MGRLVLPLRGGENPPDSGENLAMGDLLLADVANAFRAASLGEMIEADKLLSLRRELPGHSSHAADLYVVARGFAWSLAQTAAFVAYVRGRQPPTDPPVGRPLPSAA